MKVKSSLTTVKLKIAGSARHVNIGMVELIIQTIIRKAAVRFMCIQQ